MNSNAVYCVQRGHIRMFADDTVVCSGSREQMEEHLERWRFSLERRGMKYLCVNENNSRETVRLQR